MCVCVCVCVRLSGSISSLKMQQPSKELTSGSKQEQTSTDNQDSCANDAESAEVPRRRSSDQLRPSHGPEWYDPADHAGKSVGEPIQCCFCV